MASPQNARIGKRGKAIRRSYQPLVNEITVNQFRMDSQDISKWKQAIIAAKSTLNPRRRLLYELYDNILIDGHLHTVVRKRIQNITNKELLFVENNNEGKVNDIIRDEILKTPWFFKFMEFAMEAISPWGHSLVELIPAQDGKIADALLINRANVSPELGKVSLDPNNFHNGVDYRDNAIYTDNLIEIGSCKDYGDLMVAAQYVIYKRGSFGDWSQFAEIFGMPFRVGKYDPYDDDSRRKLNQGLDQMGGASHAVLPKGTDIEFHDNNGAGKSEVFKDLIGVSNEEMSKIFLGQTMTTDNGSSRSQSDTHKEVEEEITLSDMIRLEYILNWDFKDKLIAMGCPLTNGNFRFTKTKELSLEKRVDIDLKVNSVVDIAEEYWYETYGVEKPTEKSKPIEVKPPQKKTIDQAVNAYYQNSSCTHSHSNSTTIMVAAPDKIYNRIIKGIANGEITSGHVDEELYLWIADQLFKGVTEGFGKTFGESYVDEPDFVHLAKLERNIHIFSGFKTYQQLKEATALLTDENGRIRSFSDFKADVLKVNQKYNLNWLQTEFKQAVAVGQMSDKWLDIEANKKDLPLLQYVTAGDANVRASHQALNGIIKPVNDPFWNTYYPPNDWGCRCTVKQLEKGKVSKVNTNNLPQLKNVFKRNTAKTGVVFPKTHPYYKVAPEDQEAANNNFDLNIPNRIETNG